MRLKLFEADDFEIEDEITDDKVDGEEETEDGVEITEPGQEENEMSRKKVQFPLFFEATYDDSGKAASISNEDKKELAQQYADAVVETVQDNTKFIISALDIYDFEIFYDGIDVNQFVTFVATMDEEVSADLLVNVLKRYFNLQIDDAPIEQDGEAITVVVSAILDNKYIRTI